MTIRGCIRHVTIDTNGAHEDHQNAPPYHHRGKSTAKGNDLPLRTSVIASVWSAIERSPFSPADFEVITDSRDSLLRITFRHNPAYVFILTKSGSNAYTAHASPGQHETQESRAIENPSKVPDLIIAWAKDIREELRATIPIYSELDDLRDTIERHVREHVDQPQDQFDEDESDELRSKLDELMAKFQEMQERNELTQQEVNRLNQEITAIKNNLAGYPKGTWYKTAATRLLLAVSKVGTSRESRQVLAKAAQRLLGLDE